MTNKKLMVLGVACTTIALGGCCQWCNDPDCEICDDRDVVYAFNIPESQADCPVGTEYVDVTEPITIPGLGGSGIVDRGGSGIVDRDNLPVEQFCYKACPIGEVPLDEDANVDWNNSSEFIVGESFCVAE